MPRFLMSVIAVASASSVALMHVRWATLVTWNSSWIIAAIAEVALPLPLPAAEYVTEMKSGAQAAIPRATSRAVSSVRSPFGGNISNETGSVRV